MYARYGKYTEAEAEFQKAVKQDEFVPSLINLANIALIDGDKKSAVSWYDRVLKRDPMNKSALAGAIRVSSGLGDTNAVQQHLASLKATDPGAAASLAALGGSSTEGRASAQGEARVSWIDE